MTPFRRLILNIVLFPILPCFAKGPNPDDFNKPTEVEKQQTENAARMFNLYLEGKPVTDAYNADISKDPSAATNTAQGEAAVDLAKMTPTVANPNSMNQGMNPAGVNKVAATKAKVMSDISQDAVSQQAAGMKSTVENALGIQSTANTALSGMARDAVSRNISDAQSDYNSDASTKSSLTSVAGMGAGMAYDRFKAKG
jgi:hypothetical protein